MEKVLPVMIFILIGFLFVFVSKRNVAQRKKELNKNYQEAIVHLSKKVSTLMPNEDVQLKEILSLRELEFLKSLRDHSFREEKEYNPWSAQQGIITVQDIIIKINKIKKS